MGYKITVDKSKCQGAEECVAICPEEVYVMGDDGKADPKEMDESELVSHVWDSWESRDIAKQQLSILLPEVKLKVRELFKSIFEFLKV